MRYVVMIIMILVSYKAEDNQSDKKAQLAFKASAQLGEGAFWYHKENLLYWVDIEGKQLNVFNPQTGKNTSFQMPSMIGTVVPKNKVETIVALADGIYNFNLVDKSLIQISNVEQDVVQNRFNDGKCDPNGNLWVGSMHLKQLTNKASLYKVTPEGKATKVLNNVTISNGIVWSSNGKTMYYIDTPKGNIRAFDFDLKSSTISNERVVVNVDATLGYPDGMAIDAEDKLWVALWNGNAVARFDPSNGKLIDKIEVPAHNVTSCAFGGPNLDTLYITTASVDMTPKEKKKYPLAGSVFKVVPSVKGVESNTFGKTSSL